VFYIPKVYNDKNINMVFIDDATSKSAPEPVPTVSVSGSVIWNDFSNSNHTRPSVTITLLQNGAAYESIVLPVNPTANSDSYMFADLPQTDSTGTPYTYTVTQSGDLDLYSTVASGYTLTNTLK